jgi:kinesin family protein C2/C3
MNSNASSSVHRDVVRDFLGDGILNADEELRGNIRAFCRCLPLSDEEISTGASSVAEFYTARENELSIHVNGSSKKKMFKLDRVLTTQDDRVVVFVDTAPVVVSVLDGYNVCIFAYGKTRAGKTFTMEGNHDNR